jgi:hypothetical protein
MHANVGQLSFSTLVQARDGVADDHHAEVSLACLIGRRASRKPSSNQRIAGSAADVPGIGNPPLSSTSRCASIVTKAAETNSGAV